MGHAEKVPLLKSPEVVFYLPMYGIVKNSSSTTNIRIINYESAKSPTRYSLNEVMLLGPLLYQLLFTILNWLCTHLIGMSGDFSKMFREVGLHQGDGRAT